MRLTRRFARPRATAAAVLAVVLLGAPGCGRAEEGGVQILAGSAVPVSVAVARLAPLRDTLVVPGRIVPSSAADWTVVAPQPGLIAQLPKAEGDAVATGDVLVRFDIPSVTQETTLRELELLEATQRVDDARQELARITPLHERGLVARTEYEARRTAVSAAEARLTEARAGLDAARLAGEIAVVRARFPGIVANRWKNEGDFADATATDPVLRVVDPARVQIAIDVTGTQAERVRPGQAATFTGPDGQLHAATVVLRPPRIESGAGTVEIRLSPDAATPLAVDLTVEIELIFETRDNAVVVPATALRRDDSGAFVMVAGADEAAHRRDVRVGLVTGQLAEILLGVTPGDRVIVRGLDEVADGTPIVIER